MHTRKNIIVMLITSGIVCASALCCAQAAQPQDPAEVLKKEKEVLVERLRRAQMGEEIIAYQRKQLDIEQQEILKQQKIIADKERKLRARPPRDTLKQRLEAQSAMLAQARSQLDDARRNLALQIEALRSEIARQELERQSFVSKSRMQKLKRRQEAREASAKARKDVVRKREEAKKAADESRIAAAEQALKLRQEAREASAKARKDVVRKREEAKKAADKSRIAAAEQALKLRQEHARSQQLLRSLLEQQAIENEAARQAARTAQEAALRNELEVCRQSLSLMEHEMNSAQRQSIQDRMDKLLEKQRVLLDTSRQVEHDLLQQRKNVEILLEQAGATALNKGTK